MDLLKIFKVTKTNSDTNDNDYNINGDLVDATIKDPNIKFSKPKYFNYTRQYNKTVMGIDFADSEYDLTTIANAVQLDGLLNRYTQIFTEQINQNGYGIIVPNDNLQKHINGRIREIELFTNTKFKEVFDNISRQLVTYANAYVIKIRKKDLSKFGSSYKLYNRTVQPVVGLFIVDASTMKIGLDANGNIKYYKQVLAGDEKIYKVDDVIHLTYNKIPGLLTGRTPIHSVLDDVRALRKLEEEAEILGFQYAVPLYLYKVGTDSHPAAPGEVDAVAMEINNMNTFGIMCVPHTHTVETVTNNNDPIDIMKFIDHFKKRVYSGLGVSAAVMGESDTSNRNTAEAAYVAMQSITKSFQRIISNKLEIEFLKELVLDGGYDPSKFEYQVRFNEIDLEAAIKSETHVLQKYQGNLITLEEARLEINMEANLNEGDLYLNKIQIPLVKATAESQIPVIEKQADASIKIAKAAPKPTATSTSKPAISKSSKGNKATKSSEKSTTAKSQPQNQYGKQLSRPKFKKDSIESSVKYIDNLAKNLLDNSNYKSAMNRKTFLTKVYNNVNNAILQLYINDEVMYSKTLKTVMIRITDRVDRLGTIDSDEKYEYIINSIMDEVYSMNTNLELNDEEKY